VLRTVLLIHTFYPVMRIQTQRAMPVLMDDILVMMNQVDLTRPACISLIVATSEVLIHFALSVLVTTKSVLIHRFVISHHI